MAAQQLQTQKRRRAGFITSGIRCLFRDWEKMRRLTYMRPFCFSPWTPSNILRDPTYGDFQTGINHGSGRRGPKLIEFQNQLLEKSPVHY